MSEFPLLLSDDDVDCPLCGATVGVAKDGFCRMMGDGNGNHEARCTCSHGNLAIYYDITRSEAKKAAWERNFSEAYHDAQIINLRSWANCRAEWAIELIAQHDALANLT